MRRGGYQAYADTELTPEERNNQDFDVVDPRLDYNANLTPDTAFTGVDSIGFKLKQLLAKVKETMGAVFANPGKNVPMIAGIALIGAAGIMVLVGGAKGVKRKRYAGRRRRR